MAAWKSSARACAAAPISSPCDSISLSGDS
jgi:hypothetical protein